MEFRESVEQFYSSYALVYHAISNDRDFSQELNLMFEELGEEVDTYLELFAGPAEHSVEAQNKGVKTIAIDNSTEMQNIGFLNGVLQGSYIVGDIPCSLKSIMNRDVSVASIMRYSIGYLNYCEVIELFDTLSNVLCPGGIVFIELHKIQNLMNSLEDLSIKERFANVNGQKIGCVWPHGPLLWSEDDFVVDMTIQLNWYDAHGGHESQELLSREYIHTKDSIKRLIDLNRWESVQLSQQIQNYFKNSYLIAFKLN